MQNPNQPIDPLEPDVHLPGDEFWEANKGKIFAGIALVLVVSLGVISYMAWSSTRKQEAMAAFAEAKTPDAWRDIIRKYPSDPIAGNSALLLAAFLREAGQRDEARAEYDALVASRGEYPLRSTAGLALAELVASAPGSTTDAIVTAFRQAAVEFPNSYVAPYARFAAAEELARAEMNDQAVNAFREIVAEYQQSPIARMASMQVQRLAPQPAPGAGMTISPAAPGSPVEETGTPSAPAEPAEPAQP